MNHTKRHFSVYGLVIALVIAAISAVGCGGSKPTDNTAGQQAAQEAASEAAVPETTVETETETAAEAETVPLTFDPNPEYDKYALVDYMVEDIAAEFTATVSAKEDGSEYEIHCNLEGEEQIVILDKDYKIVSDKTGHMSYDAPLVVEKAVEENKWTKIGE